MTSIRYIITRSCLQDGSMRLLKYNDGQFPHSGPAQFVDDRGTEHTVHIDREQMRVTGLRTFYHDLNLGVNDVMMLTSLAPGRYQVEVIVKPHPISTMPRPVAAPAPEAKRVVVSSTPHVREVRLQQVQSVPAARRSGETGEGGAATKTEALREVAALYAASGQEPRQDQIRDEPQKPAPEAVAPAPAARPAAPAPAAPRAETPFSTQSQAAPLPPATTPSSRPEDQVAEFAALTGYRLAYPATGLMRLSADLGPQYGYSVLLAADPLAMTQPVWEESNDEARLLMTHEAERSAGLNRLTREALGVLIDHARLAPLSPVDLRGYWRAGSIDLESASSITELVSAHLAQRGTFTFVLMSLSQQPANSIISVPRLAERLGSGVNTAELSSVLETLARPPFLALTPLPGGQYLLRTDVTQLLSDLSEYAQGVRRRTAAPAQTGAFALPQQKVHV